MRNLEAKFLVQDPSATQIAAIAIGYLPQGLLRQHDTFFKIASGSLKLREEEGRAYLVGYLRSDDGALQSSEYELVVVHDAVAMKRLLAGTLGVLAEMRKQRTVLVHDNLRLHLDQVEGLGNYGEIKAAINEGDDPEAARVAVERTLAGLGVERAALIADSYCELIPRDAWNVVP